MFHRSAFTLVELLLVIGIIGVLSTVLVPYLTQYQDRARDSEKRSNVETLGLALQNYMLENQTWRTNGGGNGRSGSGYADFAYVPAPSIVGSLEAKGFLQKNLIPIVSEEKDSKYIVSGCNDMTFSVGTKLMFPTRGDKEKLLYACNGVKDESGLTANTMSGKGMNFATTRGNFCIPMPKDGKTYNCRGQDVTGL